MLEETSILVLFLILFFLLFLSAFFSSSETALMSLNRYRLRHLEQEGHRGAVIASQLLNRPDRLIGLILLGNNFVNILASAIATVIGAVAHTFNLLTLLLVFFSLFLCY